MSSLRKSIVAVPLALACAWTLGACGETVSTSSFKGESRHVAETVSDFQKNATASDEQKLCAKDLAKTLTKRLGAVGGCQAVVKQQLGQVDALNLTVDSITVNGTSAQARVKSTWAGKSRLSTLSLVREGSRWKISGSSR
jgi:hypothetical protein